jgi:hypothetical protein
VTKELWRLSKSEQIVALLALAASLAARGLALLPAYAIDDYVYLLSDHRRHSFEIALMQGRPGAAFLRELLRELDALPPASGLLGGIALTLTLVWVGIQVCRMWGIDRFQTLSCLVVLFICLHPYQAEVFTFRVAVLTLAVALGSAFYGINTCFHSRRAGITSVVAVTAALLTYQVVLNYLVMALFFSLVFFVARRNGIGEPEAADPMWLRRVFRSQLITLSSAMVCSALVTFAIPPLFHVPLVERTELLNLSELGTRAVLAIERLFVMFALGEPVMPVATKWLLVVTPLAGLLVAALNSPAGAWRKLCRRLGIPFILASVGGLPASLGIVLVLREWWPVPRVSPQVSLFWAGVFALAFLAATPLSRRLMLVLSSFILISFIGVNNHIFQDQLRVNLRDIAQANRIISRLEAMPDFPRIAGAVVIGGRWYYHSPLKTALGDMNISALSAEYSKIGLLNEVSGYNLQPAPRTVTEKARAYCSTAPRWPSPQAVTVLDLFAVVCLPD